MCVRRRSPARSGSLPAVSSWPVLRAQLRDESPDVRAAAAVAIGEAWRADRSTLPVATELLAELLRCDAAHPGVADAFMTTVAYDFDDRALAKSWTLSVLEARRGAPRPLSPVPGNDLEFYAHEWFDGDFEALGRLLDWGYVDLVLTALDHGALPREQDVAMLERLCLRHGREEVAVPLALRYGVILPAAFPHGTEVEVDEVPGRMFTQRYGQGGRWAAQWVFFEGAPFVPPPRSKDEGLAILTRLRASGLLPGDPEAQLDRTRITHIPFPDIPGARRRSFVPRQDLVLDVAQRGKSSEIVALRVVRARRPTATVHKLGG